MDLPSNLQLEYFLKDGGVNDTQFSVERPLQYSYSEAGSDGDSLIAQLSIQYPKRDCLERTDEMKSENKIVENALHQLSERNFDSSEDGSAQTFFMPSKHPNPEFVDANILSDLSMKCNADQDCYESSTPVPISSYNCFQKSPSLKIDKLTDKAPMQKSAAHTYTCSPTSRKIEDENIFSFVCSQPTWQHENDDIAGLVTMILEKYIHSSFKTSMKWRLQLGSVSALQEKLRNCEMAQLRLKEKLRQDFEEIGPGEYEKFQQSYIANFGNIPGIYFMDHCATNSLKLLTIMWSMQSKSPPIEQVQPTPRLDIPVRHSVLYSIAKGHRIRVQTVNSKQSTFQMDISRNRSLPEPRFSLEDFCIGPPVHPYPLIFGFDDEFRLEHAKLKMHLNKRKPLETSFRRKFWPHIPDNDFCQLHNFDLYVVAKSIVKNCLMFMECNAGVRLVEEDYIDIVLESLGAAKHTSWKEIHQIVESSKQQNECFADLIEHICKYFGISQSKNDILEQYIVTTRISVQKRHPTHPLHYLVEMEKKFFELEIPDLKDQALRAAINGTEIYNQAIRIHLIGALEEGKISTFRETQHFLRNIFSTQLYLPPESLSSRKSHSFIGPPNTEDHNNQPQSNKIWTISTPISIDRAPQFDRVNYKPPDTFAATAEKDCTDNQQKAKPPSVQDQKQDTEKFSMSRKKLLLRRPEIEILPDWQDRCAKCCCFGHIAKRCKFRPQVCMICHSPEHKTNIECPMKHLPKHQWKCQTIPNCKKRGHLCAPPWPWKKI